MVFDVHETIVVSQSERPLKTEFHYKSIEEEVGPACAGRLSSYPGLDHE